MKKKNPIVTITLEDGGVIRAELYPGIARSTGHNLLCLVTTGV